MELIWWVVTALICVGVVYPIYSNVQDFPFYLPNLVFIVVFVTFTRYIFLLRYTFLAKRQVLKVIVALSALPIIFLLVQEITLFQSTLDEEGTAHITKGLAGEGQIAMLQYIRTEMLLFGVGAVISAAALPVRMIHSVWRLRNRGKV